MEHEEHERDPEPPEVYHVHMCYTHISWLWSNIYMLKLVFLPTSGDAARSGRKARRFHINLAFDINCISVLFLESFYSLYGAVINNSLLQ